MLFNCNCVMTIGYVYEYKLFILKEKSHSYNLILLYISYLPRDTHYHLQYPFR